MSIAYLLIVETTKTLRKSKQNIKIENKEKVIWRFSETENARGGYACGDYACGCSCHLSSLSSPAMWALQIFSLFVMSLGC